MLATFSRRAAAELYRRVERLLRAQARARRRRPPRSPSYAGTFHAIGARLLREYAASIGLDPQFTIHDREDCGRPHELGAPRGRPHRHARALSRPRRPALRSIRASSMRARRLSETLGKCVSLGRPRMRRRCAACSRPMSRPSSARTCSITTTSCSISPRCWRSPAIARRDRGPLRSSARRRISGHQHASGRDRAGAEAAAARGSRSSATTRSRSIRFAPRPCATSSTFPKSFEPARARRHARPQLSLDRADPGRLQRRDRAAPERFAKDAVDRPKQGGAPPALVTVARRGRSGALCRDRACSPTARRARALKSQAVLFRTSQSFGRARTGADPPQHPLRQIRRPEISRRRACEGRARAAALRRESARPVAGFRVTQLLPGVGPETRRRSSRRRRRTTVSRAIGVSRAAREGARRLSPSSRTSCAGASAHGLPWPGELADVVAWLAARLEDALRRRRPSRRTISTRWSASPRPIPRASVS